MEKTLTANNEAVAKKPNGFFIQPKLTINQPNDVYEQEADAMADKVMRMEQPFIQAKPMPVTQLQRKCAHCEEEEKQAQRKEINKEETTADSNLENYVGSLSGSGQTLPNEVRNFYEPRFGYDFSNVKVHTDTVAAKSAQSINALAYTSGSNIVFNNGQYSPSTDSGKRLLGHELTHVVQQGGGVATKRIQRYSHEDCTDADLRTHIWPADGIAKTKVNDALTAISASPVSTRTEDLFLKYFMTRTPDIAEITSVFNFIKAAFDADEYTYECEDDCEEGTNAYSGWAWDIHLCMNNIRGRANDCIARTIIHEFSHKYAGTGHGWWFGTASCYNGCNTAGCPSELTPSEALTNAYSYAGFAHEI